MTGFTFDKVDLLAWFVGPVWLEREAQVTTLGLDNPIDNSDISLLDLAILEGLIETLLALFVACNDHHTRGQSIETMDQSDLLEVLLQSSDEIVTFVLGIRPWHGQQPRRFVHDEDIVILIEYGDLFFAWWRKVRRCRCSHANSPFDGFGKEQAGELLCSPPEKPLTLHVQYSKQTRHTLYLSKGQSLKYRTVR
tara:strand:+ start:10127 stop:10708 length:582 start_codon:yes stop_codon:yes gene_type:complete